MVSYGHVDRIADGSMVSECRIINADGKRSPGRPRMTWKEGVEKTMERWGLRKRDG